MRVEGFSVFHMREGVRVPLLPTASPSLHELHAPAPAASAPGDSGDASARLSNDDEGSVFKLECIDEVVGAVIHLPGGLRFVNVPSSHKSKATKRAVERDAQLLRTILSRVLDARAALEDRLRSGNAEAEESLSGAITTVTAGEAAGASAAVSDSTDGSMVSAQPSMLLKRVKSYVGSADVAHTNAEDLDRHGGLEECLFRSAQNPNYCDKKS